MTAIDQHEGKARDRNSAGIPFLITKSDVNELSHVTRAISVGTAGNLKVRTLEGDAVVIPANSLAIGIQHSIECDMVFSTGTAAAEIVGYY